MVRTGLPAETRSPSRTWTSRIIPALGTKIFAVPLVGVRYPIAVSFLAYCATRRKPIIPTITHTRNQLVSFTDSGCNDDASPQRNWLRWKSTAAGRNKDGRAISRVPHLPLRGVDNRRGEGVLLKLGELVYNSHSRCSRQHGNGDAGGNLDVVTIQKVVDVHLVVAEDVSYLDAHSNKVSRLDEGRSTSRDHIKFAITQLVHGSLLQLLGCNSLGHRVTAFPNCSCF